MNRKLAREFCMKVLFQMSIHNEYRFEMVESELQNLPLDQNQQITYIHTLTTQVLAHLAEIDQIIIDFSKGWKLNRIAKVDLSILRTALGEILYLEEIPAAVSINEAVELAKKFSADESASFINGILGKYIEEKGLKEHV